MSAANYLSHKGMMNAFRRDVLDTLLPYETRWDPLIVMSAAN